MTGPINIKNKKAGFRYELLETFSCGIILTGTEIKSIRDGKANLVDAFGVFREGELWIKGVHIAEYSHGNINNHDPKRDRKLLLKKQELRKLEKKVAEKGLTIIAIRLFINPAGLAKLDVALARGKVHHDKRDDLKEKDSKRELDRHLKGN
jgi:SsrA-binding protein